MPNSSSILQFIQWETANSRKNYEYEVKQKENKIEKLKQRIKEFQSQTKVDFQPITEKPKDFESDIFIACKEGKLTSVQWLIEKENVDKNKKVEVNDYNNDLWREDTPIHIASLNGDLPIVQYLIKKQNVDINIKGECGKTPLHYACENGHFPIVEYLISKGANIEAKDGDGWTPLQYASSFGKTDFVNYLVSKGANKNAKDNDGRTPYDVAANDEIKNILKWK